MENKILGAILSSVIPPIPLLIIIIFFWIELYPPGGRASNQQPSDVENAIPPVGGDSDPDYYKWLLEQGKSWFTTLVAVYAGMLSTKSIPLAILGFLLYATGLAIMLYTLAWKSFQVKTTKVRREQFLLVVAFLLFYAVGTACYVEVVLFVG